MYTDIFKCDEEFLNSFFCKIRIVKIVMLCGVTYETNEIIVCFCRI
jgi:hypothetical protein